MSRAFLPALLLLSLVGCQSLEKESLQQLPKEQPELTYPELLGRARLQINATQDLFQSSKWIDLENSITALHETADKLAALKRETVPALQRDNIAKFAQEWKEAATELKQGANSKDQTKVLGAINKMSLILKSLRAE